MFQINLIKNRIKYLKKRILFLKKNILYSDKKIKIKKIEIELKNFSIWKNKKYAINLKKEYSRLKYFIENIKNIYQDLVDIENFLDLYFEENDQNIFSECINNIKNLEKKVHILELHRFLSKPHDKNNCYIDIQAGSGGNEAQDWASMLMRMYLRWAENKKFKTKILQESTGEMSGTKSATLYIKGLYAYGWLRTETGIHRLVRKSPFDSGNKRHTSFSSIFVYPEIKKNINIEINPTDIRIDVYKSSGAGGQHVNCTESAVRITHIPTNIVTQCQSDRSQHKNKNQAMKQMRAKLYELKIQKEKYEKKELEKNKLDINWGHQIRSYILDDSRIKDLRTKKEVRNVSSILNGNLDFFIEESLKKGL